jgi:signal transduction histidine kinase
VRDRVDTWTASADERGVELRHRSLDQPTLVRCIPGAIEQILDNLLDNALSVAPPDSMIDVQIDRIADRTVELRVVDHGPGLDDAAKADAMRRFWRGDTSRPGTGLGLAIVDTLATSSGGRVTLADTVGGGLTVIVELPTGE